MNRRIVFARLPSDQRFCRAFEEFGGTFDRAASRNKQSHSPPPPVFVPHTQTGIAVPRRITSYILIFEARPT
jgi:hypothetical protein